MEPPIPWFVLQSPWAWLGLALWLLFADACAPRWRAWWTSGAAVAAWMAAAVAVLPWHLFTRSPLEVFVLWATWLGCSACVGVVFWWLEGAAHRRDGPHGPHTTSGAPPPAPAPTATTDRDS